MTKSSSPASERSAAGKLWGFFDQRLGLSDILEIARHKTVPQHAQSVWYFMGGLTLFFFIVQIISGTLLLIYYQPGESAYDSVRRITYDVDFGWLIRSAHSWSANLMIFVLFVHMFSVYFMKAYRRPREFGWWSGLVLLGLTMTFGFSGYLLPMDELSFFATKVGLEIPSKMPLVGPAMADLLRGGPTVGPDTVHRFFALHVVILPALFVLFLAFHLFLVQRHGNAVPPSEEQKPESARRSIRFFPDFLLKDLAMWLIALNVLGLFACLYPWDLGLKADPVSSTPVGIHPEWYFMSQFQLLKVLGNWFPGAVGEVVGILMVTVSGLIWALVPLFDRSSDNRTASRIGTWIGILALAGLIALTIWGYAAL